MENLIELGRCHKPHGIKGAFHFVLENVEESVLEKGMEITIFPFDEGSSVEPSGQVMAISKIQFGNKVICYLEGVNDRNTVEAMIPFTIKVDRSVLPELEEGEFYISDVIGAKVIEHTTDKEIGTVIGSSDNGMQTILQIRLESGTLEIPWVDHFVPEVDVANKTIRINKPEFLD